MPVIALYHFKGGVGKTTAAVNLAYLSAADGFKTLLIDLDPQASASFYYRVRTDKSFTRKSLLKNRIRREKNIKGSDFPLLDILPATLSYRKLDIALSKLKRPKMRLLNILKQLKKQYDIIFIDAPAGLDLVAENIFMAADVILLPLIPTTLSVMTLHRLASFIDRKKIRKSKLCIFFSMVEGRKKIHQKTMAEIRGEFEPYNAIIPYSAIVEKMGIQRQPLSVFSSHSHAARSFTYLWTEIKEKHQLGMK